jgi:hypothetical protein
MGTELYVEFLKVVVMCTENENTEQTALAEYREIAFTY